ncbi:MAG: transcriptional repressor [Chloroflexota bacterium]
MTSEPDSVAAGKGAQIRLTPQRRAVLEAVLAAGDHPRATDIYERVRRRHPGIAFATIYNALRYLAAHGLISEITFGDAASRFDGRTDRHDHAVCERCGVLCDVHVPLPEDVRALAAAQSGFRIMQYRVEFRGLCPQCAAQEKGSLGRSDGDSS